MAVAAVVTGVEGGRVLLRPVRRRWPDLRTGDSAVLELLREGESFQWFGTVADPDGLVISLPGQAAERRHRRWRVGDAGRVAWRRAGDLGEPDRARMLDVSEGGVGFFTANPPQPGDLVELDVEVPGTPRLMAVGRVVRVVPWAGGVCLVGVEFTRVDAAELEAFIRSMRVRVKVLMKA
ncbi:MAG: PilZ domain-containing protein [Bacillota bacterium]